MKYSHSFKIRFICLILTVFTSFALTHPVSALSIERSRASVNSHQLGDTYFVNINGTDLEWEIDNSSVLHISLFGELDFKSNASFPWNGRTFTKIVLDAGSHFLRHIGSKAFSSYRSLHTINFPACENLVSIDTLAFEGCTSLRSIILPKKFEPKFYVNSNGARMNEQDWRKYYGINPNCNVYFLDNSTSFEVRIAHEQKMNDILKDINNLRNSLGNMSRQLTSANDEINRLKQEKDNMKKAIDRLQSENAALQSELKTASNKFAKDIDTNSKNIAALQTQNKTLNTESANLRELIKNVEKNLTTTMNQKFDNQYKNLKTEIDKLASQFKRYQSIVKELQRRQ